MAADLAQTLLQIPNLDAGITDEFTVLVGKPAMHTADAGTIALTISIGPFPAAHVLNSGLPGGVRREMITAIEDECKTQLARYGGALIENVIAWATPEDENVVVYGRILSSNLGEMHAIYNSLLFETDGDQHMLWRVCSPGC